MGAGHDGDLCREAAAEIRRLRSELERRDAALRYWNARAVAAEEYISLSPCDPDIYGEQWEA